MFSLSFVTAVVSVAALFVSGALVYIHLVIVAMKVIPAVALFSEIKLICKCTLTYIGVVRGSWNSVFFFAGKVKVPSRQSETSGGTFSSSTSGWVPLASQSTPSWRSSALWSWCSSSTSRSLWPAGATCFNTARELASLGLLKIPNVNFLKLGVYWFFDYNNNL